MDCEQCREVVSAALDGEADGAEEALAQAHASGCEACRAAAERMTTVTRWARLAPAEFGPDVVDLVLDRLVTPTTSVVPLGLPGVGATPHHAGLPPALSDCGCAPACRCGCQQGGACRCRPTAA